MAEPLAISTGQGKGFATVLPASGVNYYELKLKRQAAEAKKREDDKAREQKIKTDLFDTLNDLEVTGFIPHTQQLNEEKIGIQKYMTEKYMQNENYNPNTDSEFAKKFGDFKLHNKVSTDIKDWHKSEWAKLQANKDIWDVTSTDTLSKFFKMPLAEQTKFITDYGFPQLTPKKEVLDYDSEIAKLVPKPSGNTIEVLQPNGTTKTESVDAPDVGAMQSIAQRFADAGFKGINTFAGGLVRNLKSEFADDAQFKLLDEEEQDQFINAKAYEHTLKVMKDYAAKNYSSTIQGGTGGGFSFGDDFMENDKVKVVYSENPSMKIYDIAQIKGTENANFDFKTADGDIIYGKPLRIEKSKDKGWTHIVVGVPETETVTVREGAQTIEKKVLTGKIIEKSVPYSSNENRVMKGKFNFTISDIDKGLSKKGVQVEQGTSKKEVTQAISLAEAKNANPTFKGTDAELIAKYKKHGYTVK
ncbi:MAG: hypothetical protein A2Z57_04025 [Planctomycetes bacterium RIFCSPHIGHO2_12_39_6]|nr:MAG: hypothetical protein A2Z57_04025 [Planctomycetes bacterium RIFCSPHIGHO2_12_39_6]